MVLLVDEACTRCMRAPILPVDIVPLAREPGPNLFVRFTILGLATLEWATPHWMRSTRQFVASFVTQTEEVFLVILTTVAIMSMFIWLEIRGG
jgi:hypothetical protein